MDGARVEQASATLPTRTLPRLGRRQYSVDSDHGYRNYRRDARREARRADDFDPPSLDPEHWPTIVSLRPVEVPKRSGCGEGTKRNIRMDTLNIMSAIEGVRKSPATCARFSVLAVTVISAALCLYRPYHVGATVPGGPSIVNGTAFYARLDLTFLGLAYIYPITFITGANFNRRELCLTAVAKLKAQLIQMLEALLTWRDNGDRSLMMSPEWDLKTLETFVKLAEAVRDQLVKIPHADLTRHYHTEKGIVFRKQSRLLERRSMLRVVSCLVAITELMEDLKLAETLSMHETNRIGDYYRSLNEQVEVVLISKRYRSPIVADSYLACTVIVAAFVFGPYYAYVSYYSYGGGATFAVLLSVMSAIIITVLMHWGTATDDTFIHKNHREENIQIEAEAIDMIRTFGVIYRRHAKNRRAWLARDPSAKDVNVDLSRM